MTPRTLDRIIALSTWWTRIAWTALALYLLARIAQAFIGCGPGCSD